MTYRNIKSLNIPNIPAKFPFEEDKFLLPIFSENLVHIYYYWVSCHKQTINKCSTNSTLNPFLFLIFILQSLFSKSNLVFLLS